MRVTTNELYHLWANRHGGGIRAKSVANIRAEGDYLFSYGTIIGACFPNVTYISSYRYSNTTSKHQGMARQAARGNVIELNIDFPEFSPYTGQEKFEKRLADQCRYCGNKMLKGLESAVTTARKINKDIQNTLNTYEQLLDFACTVDKGEAPQRFSTLEELKAYLKEGRRVSDLASAQNVLNWTAEKISRIQQMCSNGYTDKSNAGQVDYWLDHNAEKDFKEELRILCEDITTLGGKVKNLRKYKKIFDYAPNVVKAAQQFMESHRAWLAEKNAKDIKAWREGGSQYHLPHGLRPMLRISSDGDKIETSWGATVPVDVAPGLWELICVQREKEENLEIVLEVGNYTLERVFHCGSIKVGCHVIEYAELQGIAEKLKLGYVAEEVSA